MPKSCFLISDLHVDHYLGSHTTVGAIKNFLGKHMVPADIVSVAGDISDSATTFTKTIEALSEMYGTVLYTHGNHDYTVRSAAETSEAKLYRAVSRVKAKNALHLDGSIYEVPDCGSLVGGSMGAYDFSYSKKHFGLERAEMLVRWEDWYDGRHWNLDCMGYGSLQAREDAKVLKCVDAGCNLMITHIGPHAWNIQDKFHNYMTGYFYFDGMHLLDKMPSGSVWHFGHTHDKKILDLGNVRLMCNPLGYPGEAASREIPKEEFVITLG